MQSHDPKIPFPPYWAQPSSTPASTSITSQDKPTLKTWIENQRVRRPTVIDVPSPPDSTKSSEGGIGEEIAKRVAIQAGVCAAGWAISKTMEYLQSKPATPKTPPPAAAPTRPPLGDLIAAHKISCAGFFASSESKEKCAQIKEAIRRMAAVEAEAVISPKPN